MIRLDIDAERLKLAVRMARSASTIASLDTLIVVQVRPDGLVFVGRHKERAAYSEITWEEIAYVHEAVLKTTYERHLHNLVTQLTAEG